MQYIFNGPECEIKIKPHGNSKQDRPFFRTSSTTKEHIKKVASKHTPKEAMVILIREQGGVESLKHTQQLVFLVVTGKSSTLANTSRCACCRQNGSWTTWCVFLQALIDLVHLQLTPHTNLGTSTSLQWRTHTWYCKMLRVESPWWCLDQYSYTRGSISWLSTNLRVLLWCADESCDESRHLEFTSNFPYAVQLRCFLHFKRMCKRSWRIWDLQYQSATSS